MNNRRLPDPPKPADPVPAVEANTAKRPPSRPTGAPTLSSPARSAPTVRVTPEARRALIAESAYLRAERRGFEPGHEDEDWLAAETEVDGLLRAGQGARQ
jgi:hypothetical protein